MTKPSPAKHSDLPSTEGKVREPKIEATIHEAERENHRDVFEQTEQELERLSEELGMLNEALREKLMEVKALTTRASNSCSTSGEVRVRVRGLEQISGIILMKQSQGYWVLENLPIDLFQEERLQADAEQLKQKMTHTQQQSFRLDQFSEEEDEAQEPENGIPTFQVSDCDPGVLEKWKRSKI